MHNLEIIALVDFFYRTRAIQAITRQAGKMGVGKPYTDLLWYTELSLKIRIRM